MTLRQVSRVAIGVVALSCALRAQAQSLQKISVSPASPTAHQQVTVTVEGNNPCGAVGITYGDGETIVYPISALPLRQTHTYATPGQKTLSAQGHGNCTGQVSTTIVVAPAAAPPTPPAPPAAPAAPIRSLEELCRRVECGRDIDAGVVVTDVFGVQRPGGTAGVAGRGFGAAKAIVRAYLKRRDGSAVVQELSVVSWTDGLIEVAWPSAPAQVSDQDATIQVETANRVRSNEYGPVAYQPVRLWNQRAENQKVHDDIARRLRDRPAGRPTELDAIRREARELWLKAPSASPAERAAIDRRAAELLARLGRERG